MLVIHRVRARWYNLVVRPLFASPKTDFAFKKIFGDANHPAPLIGLLNGLLELDASHHIVHVDILPPEQVPSVETLKYSIVDVKCTDAQGTQYVVEMQVLNVEAFEKRVVYNVAKAYSAQLGVGETYPDLNDVIGVTICDFELWPDDSDSDAPSVPMLSRWRMVEQHNQRKGMGQLQFVFLELPKYDARRPPQTMVEKWAYFFRETGNLDVVPEVLSESPFTEALEQAKAAGFTEAEWEAYIRAGMAIQDERGALSVAKREGRKEGEEAGREALRGVVRNGFAARGWGLDAESDARLSGCEDLALLQTWAQRVLTVSSADEVWSER